MTTGFAIIGCGYIADYYEQAAAFHTDALTLRAVFDRNPERLAAHAALYNAPVAESLEAVLADPSVDIVLNLTDPHNHEAVTRAAIAAGKHVYSEKPLAMTAATARDLADTAAEAGVCLAGAPCNFLGEAAQTLARAVREERVGPIHLVYAEMDDGMIHRAPYRDWSNPSGAPWPARGEFAVGCTFEHAGYTLGVLVAMFGPVRRVTAFSHLCIPEKRTDPPLADPAPDISVGCLEFDNGIVARMTNSVVAAYDHRLRLFGEEGVLSLAEPWSYHSPVSLSRTATTRLERLAERKIGWRPSKRIAPVRKPRLPNSRKVPSMDFMAGVRELSDAIREDRPCRLSPELAVHITEVTEVVQHPDRFPVPYTVESTVPPIAPMPWAR